MNLKKRSENIDQEILLISVIRSMNIQFVSMPTKINKKNTGPLFQLVKNWFNKLFQSPDTYPIRYYKKGKRFRRY